MFSTILSRSSFVRFSLIAFVMVLGTFMNARSTQVAFAEQQESIKQPDMQLEPSEAQAISIVCRPGGVAVLAERIHVACIEPANGIVFFALSTTDSRHAARVLSVLLTAHATGKTLNIAYDPDDTSGSNFGCEAQNCRIILMAEVAG